MFENIRFNQEATVVDSLCMECKGEGQTRMLFTKIPAFREVIIVSFECPNCGCKNNEVQFGGQIASSGIQLRFQIHDKTDLDRELVKSAYATLRIPQIQLQIPSNNRGQITTVEGVLSSVINDLEFQQPVRKVEDPQCYDKIQTFISKVKALQQNPKFQLLLRDPSGNSYIKNPYLPKCDPRLKVTQFFRTKEEILAMGFSLQNAEEEVRCDTSHKIDFTRPFNEENILKQEGIGFPTVCFTCGLEGQIRMCQTSVPYFKDLIIMAFTCDYCGTHNSQVKTSGAIPQRGRKIILCSDETTMEKDLRRDLFKSDTCGVSIPQLQLELGYGTLGGVFTTVEGLIEKISDHLKGVSQFVDSDRQFSVRMQSLFAELQAIRQGSKKFTMILDDPLAHSFLQNPDHPGKDMNVRLQEYERSFQQNEDLGLNDMKV